MITKLENNRSSIIAFFYNELKRYGFVTISLHFDLESNITTDVRSFELEDMETFFNFFVYLEEIEIRKQQNFISYKGQFIVLI